MYPAGNGNNYNKWRKKSKIFDENQGCVPVAPYPWEIHSPVKISAKSLDAQYLYIRILFKQFFCSWIVQISLITILHLVAGNWNGTTALDRPGVSLAVDTAHCVSISWRHRWVWVRNTVCAFLYRNHAALSLMQGHCRPYSVYETGSPDQLFKSVLVSCRCGVQGRGSVVCSVMIGLNDLKSFFQPR